MVQPPLVQNFGGNLKFQPTAIYTPQSEAEVLQILDRHRGQSIRVIGRLHSWSDVPVAEGVLIDLREMSRVAVDSSCNTATVGAGCQIKQLLAELDRQGGFTLPSLGLITEQTIAGAASTGTHGSGKHSLSHYIEAVRVARYDRTTGEPVIVEIDSGDELRAARCSLGSLGVIVSVTIRCRPAYRVEEHFQRYESLERVLEQETDYPLQQFFLVPWKWCYFGQHRREVEKPKSRLAWLYRIYWTIVFDVGMHLLILFALRFVRLYGYTKFLFRWVIPLGVIRGWKVVDRSEKILVMEHELFRHIETELFVRKSELPLAMQFVREVIEFSGGRRAALSPELQSAVDAAIDDPQLDQLAGRYCHHYPICVRTILPDETLISMACGEGESWYSISLISYAHPDRREGFFHFSKMLTFVLAEACGARPHWGKYHALPVEVLRPLYPKFPKFQSLCDRSDPDGRFRNRWTRSLLTTGQNAVDPAFRENAAM